MSASCSSRVRFEVSTTAGRRLARDRPDLGDRDLEVGEDLEQERLELVVGAVDLVDQQHDRLVARRSPRAAGAGSGTRGRTAPPRRPCPPARRGCAAAGAGSSTRRRRARRRAPRSTGGGSAVRPSAVASAFASLGLADAGLALEQQRLLEGERRGTARSRGPGRAGSGFVERVLELVDRGEGSRGEPSRSALWVCRVDLGIAPLGCCRSTGVHDDYR